VGRRASTCGARAHHRAVTIRREWIRDLVVSPSVLVGPLALEVSHACPSLGPAAPAPAPTPAPAPASSRPLPLPPHIMDGTVGRMPLWCSAWNSCKASVLLIEVTRRPWNLPTVLWCIVPCFISLDYTGQHCTVPCRKYRYCTMSYSTVLYCTVLYCTALDSTAQCCNGVHCTLQCVLMHDVASCLWVLVSQACACVR